MIEAGINYLFQNKLYIWERRKESFKNDSSVNINPTEQRQNLQNTAKLGGEKLRDLAWSLDILDMKKDPQ